MNTKKKVFCENCIHYKNDGIWYCYHSACFDEAIDPKNGKTIRARKKDKFGYWYDYVTFNFYGNCDGYKKRITLLEIIKKLIRNIIFHTKTFFNIGEEA